MTEAQNVTKADKRNFEIYKLTEDRNRHDQNRVWTQFQVFISINTVAISLLALAPILLARDVNAAGDTNSNTLLFAALIAVPALIGAYISCQWHRLLEAERQYQEYSLEFLRKLEGELGLPDLFTGVLTLRAQRQKKTEGVFDAMLRTTDAFKCGWIALFVVVVALTGCRFA